MLVETFETTEIDSSCKDAEAASEEQVELMQELDLTGQLELVSGAGEDGEAPQISPYRLMTDEEYRVYKVLCPETIKPRDFNEHAIPLRVLQVLAHATQLGTLGDIRIWARKSSYIKDPVLVGILSDYNWDRKIFLLARWGEELRPFEELRTLAGKLLKQTKLAEFLKVLSTAKARVSALGALDDEFVISSGEKIGKPSLSEDE